jgi:hypothetical protein
MERDRTINSPLLQSISIVAICIIVYLLGPPSIYETNDDVFYNLVMSGDLLINEPDAHTIFINIILSSLFVKLYHAASDVPWFGLFQVSSLLFSVFFLNYTYSSIFNRNYIIRLLLSVISMLPFLYYIQFTKTAFVLAITGYLCIYMLNHYSVGNSYTFIIPNIISLLLIILSYLLRSDSFLLATVLCFILMLRVIADNKKTLNALVAACIMIVIGCHFIHKASYDQQWQDFFAVKKTTGAIVDYDQIQYDHNLFSKAGLSMNDYLMIKIWGYSDDKIFNKDSLNYISDNSVKLKAADNTIAYTLQSAVALPALSYIVAMASLTILMLLLYKHTYGQLCLSIVIPLVLCILYLCIQGRFPTRISTPIACWLPWAVLVFSGDARKNPLTICSSVLFAALFMTAAYRQFTEISAIVQDRLILNNKLHELGRDSAHHQVTLATLGAAFPYEAILPFESPKYLAGIRFVWLAGMNQSPIQKKQLTAIGIQDLFATLLTGDRIYISFDPAVSDIIRKYYLEHYKVSVGFLPVPLGNSFAAYKVTAFPR